jgi:hypothetical protein
MPTFRFSKSAKRFGATNTNTLDPATPIGGLSPTGNCDLCVTPFGHTPTGCWERWAASRVFQMVITDWDFTEYVTGELDTGMGGIPPAELDEVNTLKIYLDSTKWLNGGLDPCGITQTVTIQTTNIRVEASLIFSQGTVILEISQGRAISEFAMSLASRFRLVNTFVANPLLQFNPLSLSQWRETSSFTLKQVYETAANYPETFNLAKVFYS